MSEPNPNSDQNETITSPASPTGVDLDQSKRFSKKLLIILGIILLVTLVCISVYILTRDKPEQSSQGIKNPQPEVQDSLKSRAVEQVFVSPIDNSKTPIKENSYYAVKVDASEYYGQVSKINDDYIRLLPTAYKKSGALVFTGNELHGPEPATYFRISKITKFQELTDRAIIDAMNATTSSVSDPFPTKDISRYIKSGQFQAYFFADNVVFFAKTTSLNGTFLAKSSHVYVLRTNSATGSASTRPDISLVLAKPEQYNKLTADKLLYWQNMKPDSQIVKAATAFEKQQ